MYIYLHTHIHKHNSLSVLHNNYIKEFQISLGENRYFLTEALRTFLRFKKKSVNIVSFW